MSSKSSSSGQKRKRKDDASTPADASGAPSSAADLKRWMREVIAAPPAPEDAPAPGEEAQPIAVSMDTEEAEEDDMDIPMPVRTAEGENSAAATVADGTAATVSAAPSSSSSSFLSAPLAGAGVVPRPTSIPRTHYTSVRDLFTALQSSKVEVVFGGLVRFHRQMRDETVHGVSLQAAVGTPAQPILTQYWSLSPDAKELFGILDNIKQFDGKKINQLLGKVLEVMSRMMLPSIAGFQYAQACTMLRKMVRSKHFQLLGRMIKMSDQRLIQSALYFMMHAIMCCGSNRTHLPSSASSSSSSSTTPSTLQFSGASSHSLLREFVTKFDWSAKPFLEIPYKPFQASSQGHNKDKATPVAGATDPQTLMLQSMLKSRHLFVQILIELLLKKDLQITSHLLGIKGYLTAVLKHMKNDLLMGGHLDAFLHAIIQGILHLPGLSNTAKFGFFNSYVLEHLLDLFRPKASNILSVHVLPATVRMSPMRAMKEQVELIERTMREFVGYIAKNQTSGAAAAAVARANRANPLAADASLTPLRQYGPPLLRILHSLHANESLPEQRLLLDILSLFPPQLLAEFLSKFSYTFDPRPSFRWVNHVALMEKLWEIKWEMQEKFRKDRVLLQQFQSWQGAARGASASANQSTAGQQVPSLFAYLLPSTLSQRIILSQCIQHTSPLVKYTTLNLLRSLLQRFSELVAEYKRQWLEAQGMDAALALGPESALPAPLQGQLASFRSHLSKTMPDVQVLFGLRIKCLPWSMDSVASLADMQKELLASASSSSSSSSEPPNKKVKKADDDSSDSDEEEDVGDKKAGSEDEQALSTLSQGQRSRHIMYSRFLSVMAHYAYCLPEALLEGRIDVFKLLPPALASSEALADATQPIGQGLSSSSTLSWWSLHELLNMFHHTAAYKHVRLFVLSQPPKNQAEADRVAPLSYFGQLLRLYLQLQHSAEFKQELSKGELTLQQQFEMEQAAAEGRTPEKESLDAPRRVVERVKQFLTQMLLHTGIFSSSAASASASPAAISAAVEEIHFWLSSLRSLVDVRFFEQLVAFLTSSSGTSLLRSWEEGFDQEQTDAEEAESTPKLSVVLSTLFTPSFHSAFALATPTSASHLLPTLRTFLFRFLAGVLHTSPTFGSLVRSQVIRAICGQISKVQSGEIMVKENAKGIELMNALAEGMSNEQKVQAAVEAFHKKEAASANVTLLTHPLASFQALLARLESTPGDMQLLTEIASSLASTLPLLSDVSKDVLLCYLREVLLKLLAQSSNAPEDVGVQRAIGMLWSAVEQLVLSADFELEQLHGEATEASRVAPKVQTKLHADRLSIVFARSAASKSALIEHFHPTATEGGRALLAQLVMPFLLGMLENSSSLTFQTTPLHGLVLPFLERVAGACVRLAAEGKDMLSESWTELPFALHLLQRCLPLFVESQLTEVSRAFCDLSASNNWIHRIASLPSADSAQLAEQLLQYGGAHSVQMLAGLLVSTKGAAAEGKKSKKSRKSVTPAAETSGSSSFVLERLLLKLLLHNTAETAQLVSQLQPSFFAFCLDSIHSLAASASDAETGAQESGSELYAHLASLFLSAEVSPLYVHALVQHVVSRFGLEGASSVELDESATAQLLHLLPLLVRAVSSLHLGSCGQAGESFISFLVQQALGEVFLPHFLAHHAAVSKAAASTAASSATGRQLQQIIELARAITLGPHTHAKLDAYRRQQLLQLVLTGSQPALLGENDEEIVAEKKKKKQADKKKKKKSKKKADSSSDSSSSDSSDSSSSESEDEDESMLPSELAPSPAVPTASSSYDSFDALRFDLAHVFLTSFVAPTGAADVDPTLPPSTPGAASRTSMVQSYLHFMSQAMTTLHKGLKAKAKQQEKLQELQQAALLAAQGGDVSMLDGSSSSKSPKGLMSMEFETKLVSTLMEMLSCGLESTFPVLGAVVAINGANDVKWVCMQPLALLLLASPNPALNAAVLSAYSKLFPSLLRFGYTDLPLVCLLRHLLSWQLSGSFSRYVFSSRISTLKSNPHFTTLMGVDEKGEAIEEPEVPSLLSICALASSPEAENFQPLSALPTSLVSEADALSSVPSAQTLFELMVSHSKFVSVIAPHAVAAAEGQESEEEKSSVAAAATALQLEYLRLLLLLFSFPDASPPADFQLQSNLWLLLLSAYSGSTSTSDTLIKLLLDLFEEIALGEKARKKHRKMEFELIVAHRKWGAAGLQLLVSKMNEGAEASSQATTLTEQDPTTWIYTNFNTHMLHRGPIVSKKPDSKISHQAVVATTNASVEGQTGAAAGDKPTDESSMDDSSLEVRYDPSFLLPLLHDLLSHHTVDLRRLIDLNLLGFVIQCMSHQATHIRRMAYAVMGKFEQTMEAANAKVNEEKKKKEEEEAKKKKEEEEEEDEDEKKDASSKKEKVSKKWEAKKALYHESTRSRTALGNDGLLYAFKEYPQISLLLTAFKNGITQKFQLVPGIITTFLSRALPILLRPEHVLYKSINRFLLARPLLDLGDIPLFYNYFHSSLPDTYRLQRTFLLRVLRDGFTTFGGEGDYALWQRRHVSTMLLHFVGTKTLSDKLSRHLALQALEGAMLCSPQALAELVRVHAFFPWVHAQLLQLSHPNQWGAAITLLRLFERSVTELRNKMPELPEPDMDIQEGADASLVEEAESEREEEEVPQEDEEMRDVDADGDALISEHSGDSKVTSRKEKQQAAASKAAAALSPELEALKALRKRQRQRAQVAREVNMVLEALSVKFHEYLFSEGAVTVVPPTVASLPEAHVPALLHSQTSSTFSASTASPSTPLTATSSQSLQVNTIESVLPILVSLLRTGSKAHVASRRLTNRVQQVEEGRRKQGEEEEQEAEHPLAGYAPFAFKPLFLRALISLPSSSTGSKLSPFSLEQILQIITLSSPSPVVPSSLEQVRSPVLLQVQDSREDVQHHFAVLTWMVEQVLRLGASSPSLLPSFIRWLDLLLQSHPRLLSAWWEPKPHVALSRGLVSLYALLSSQSARQEEEAVRAQTAVHTLNTILARVMGQGKNDQLVQEAINAISLSSAQRNAYLSAWRALPSALSSLSSSLPSSALLSSPSLWLSGFSSLLLQELLKQQLQHVLHGATPAQPADESSTQQSAAFSLLATTSKPDKQEQKADKKKGAEAVAKAQLQLLETLQSAASAFTRQ